MMREAKTFLWGNQNQKKFSNQIYYLWIFKTTQTNLEFIAFEVLLKGGVLLFFNF